MFYKVGSRYIHLSESSFSCLLYSANTPKLMGIGLISVNFFLRVCVCGCARARTVVGGGAGGERES